MDGNFAQRMMQKMGWKEGLGLGKAHQGITTPLEHQKTDKRSGVIRAAEQMARAAEGEEEGPPEKKARGVSFQGTPSRVVLLRNIVGPGEVSDRSCNLSAALREADQLRLLYSNCNAVSRSAARAFLLMRSAYSILRHYNHERLYLLDAVRRALCQLRFRLFHRGGG